MLKAFLKNMQKFFKCKKMFISLFPNIYRNYGIRLKIRLIKFRIIFPAHSSISSSASLSESKKASECRISFISLKFVSLVGNLIIDRRDIIHKHIFTHEMAKMTPITGKVSRRYAAFFKGASNQ